MRHFLSSAILSISIFVIIGCGGGSTSTNVANPAPKSAASTPAAPVTPVINTTPKVVFIGDSISYLFDAPGFGQPEFSQHSTWIDAGVVGDNTNQILARFQSQVIDAKPDVVVILGGTNDVYPGWQLCVDSEVPKVFLNKINSCTNVEAMVSMAKAAHIAIVLGTVPPWSCSDAVKCALANTADSSPSRYDRINQWNQWLRQYAFDNDIVIADYWSALVSPDEQTYVTANTWDGVHPSAAGYAVMTPIVEAAIQQAVQQ